METNGKTIDIGRFLDGDGRVIQLPKKYTVRMAVLAYLSGKFERGKDYGEQEVNLLCDRWHTFGDHALLRRELVDSGYLSRERNGSRYWRA